ncbi:hypothetical protein SAMN04488552_0199 [Christiangramia echinicola]|uniref:Uncharacterized protein n=1 Tax=Christiangramia echinicola TaxID=279359 RepID=A0A1H1KVM5_9FLAO|nr:hypothetical protein SAMN04488552_0199 [Christiangramia echinicola]
MTTYKEQQKKKQYYVLLENCTVQATFGNLKKVCEFMNGKEFYSYHTLVRKEFPVSYKDYKLFKVKHY